MGGVLFQYLSKMLLQRTFGALLGLVALLQIVDLFDATSDVLSRGLGVMGIIHYEALRLAGMIQQILPVSVLIGALATFTGLARNSEMSALRSTGVTIYRLLVMLLPSAGLMAALHFIIADQIAPRSEQAFSVWWGSHPVVKVSNDQTVGGDKKPKTVWFRTDGYLVYATGASADGRRLDDLKIYRRDPGGRLSSRILAKTATYGDDHKWRLAGAQGLEIDPTGPSTTPAGPLWNTSLAPADVVAVFAPEDRISAERALHALTGDRPADKSPAFYSTRVQRGLAEPLGALVMLMLAAPAALAHQRNDQTTLLLFSLGSGLLFLMVDGVLTALGQTNVLPPILGAWAGPALFAALAGAALVHLEG